MIVCSLKISISLCAIGACVAFMSAAAEAKEMVLYSFCQSSGCPDGQTPVSSLVRDGTGNLYGTTIEGGNASNSGTIYELQKGKRSWAFHSLYSFCSQANCTDGSSPSGGLVVDTSGNLYGTTYRGGNANEGVVYELPVNGPFKVLYSFCAQSQCVDGSYPAAGLAYQGQQSGQLYDGSSTLYGTASSGGTMNWGVVYAIAPAETESVLYSFGADNNSNDGQGPQGSLVMDSAGNLYGTTTFGGSTGDGTIFGISPSGSEMLLFAFCSQEGQDCGSFPGPGALLMRSDGTLLGTTLEREGNGFANGVVYSFEAGSYSTLANFCVRTTCRTGADPFGGLIADSSGNLYGTAGGGGNRVGSNAGTVFELAGSTLKAIHSFCSQPNCADGKHPAGTLLMNNHGALFGTTTEGGAFNGGTIFELP